MDFDDFMREARVAIEPVPAIPAGPAAPQND
jgi:hypothetical protein